MASVLLSIIRAAQMGITLANDNRSLDAKIRGRLSAISQDLEMIYNSDQRYHHLQMQELVYDIEKFMCLLRIPGKAAAFFLAATGMETRSAAVTEIEIFQERIKSTWEDIKRESDAAPKISESSQSQSIGTSSAISPSYTPETHLVGFPETRVDFVELLSPDHGHLRVISIVGCKGSGKTALARAVYDHTVVSGAFGCKAWVVVPECNDADDSRLTEIGEGVLRDILKQVDPEQRYLVCIDDLQKKQVLDKIRDGLHRNSNMGSRILITTNVHSIAGAYSRGSYMYKMQCLDRPSSKELLLLKAFKPSEESSEKSLESVADGSEVIVDKCGGLPLALISAGNFLNGIRQLSCIDCIRVGKQLGVKLGGAHIEFAEMKRALVQCYDNLPSYSHKNCLIYACIIPRSHQISSKNLARRLIAEGLVDKDVSRGIPDELDFAHNCLEELINQSMIERVLVDNNSKVVQRCKVQRIVLEYSIEKSLSTNFVTLVDEHSITRNNHAKVRRLIIAQRSTEGRSRGISREIDLSFLKRKEEEEEKEIDLSDVWSLAIFKYNLLQRPQGYFQDCIILRVLDLESCTGLDNGVLADICGLVFLSYLGLRKTDVNQLPKEVEKLRLLQTLDIRETSVEKLPLEVIMLPVLTYLFGKFELSPLIISRDRDFIEFLSNESKLHTLAGIIVGETNGFEVILQHAKELRKVKIWCKNTTAPSNEAQPSLPAPSNTALPDPSNEAQPSLPAPSNEAQPPLPAPSNTSLPAPSNEAQPSLPAPSNEAQPSIGEVLPKHPRPSRAFKFLQKFAFSCMRPKRNAVPSAPSSSAPNPAPATAPAGSLDASSSAPNLAPATGPSTPTSKAGGAHEPNTCVSRLTVALEKRDTAIGLESLSIDFNGVPNDFLASLKTTSTIRSIKVRRGQGNLPEPHELEKVRNINKLHLFSTGHSITYLAEALQSLRCLEHLKLADNHDQSWDGNFDVKADGFNSLHWLCFEARKHPRISIERGGMKQLASLLLLCEESPPQMEEAKCQKEKGKMEEASGIKEVDEEIFGVKGISHLTKLNEVILHRSTPDTKVAAWKTATEAHMNKPYVKKQEIISTPSAAVEVQVEATTN